MSRTRRIGGASRRTKGAGALAVAIAAAAAALAGNVAAADAAAGRTKASMCITCHGERGISVLPNAPHLAGQPAVYTAEQLRQFRSGRRPSEVMGVIAKPLTDRDIDDLAAWYESVRITADPGS